MSGFFEEQSLKNKKNKKENLDDAFKVLEEAISGKSIYENIDKNDIAKGAISLVCKYFHIRVNDDSYPREVETFEAKLEYRLKPHGIMTRHISLTEGWYKNAIYPMLATIKDSDQIVLLIPNSFEHYYYYDLKTGEKVKLKKKMVSSFKEEAIVFYKPLPLTKLSGKDLFRYSLSLVKGWDIFKIVLSIAFITILGMFTPKFTQVLFSEVIKQEQLSILLAMAMMMVGVAIGTFLMRIFNAVVTDKLVRRIKVQVESGAMMRMLSLPPSFFKDYSSGELAYRLLRVSESMKLSFETICNGGIFLLFSLLYFVSVASVTAKLFLPAFIIVLLQLLITLLIAILQARNSKVILEEASKENGLSYNIMSGVEKIKVCGSEERAYNRWAKQEAKLARATYSPNILIRLNKTIVLAISLIGNIVIFLVANHYKITVADYYAFTTAYGLLNAVLTKINLIINDVSQIKPSLQMAAPILEALPEVNGSKSIVTKLNGAIELNNVSFKYKGNTNNIIDGISLKIKSGEYVAIVGKTGCGKSTLIRLLLGFESPNKGSIYYDGRDISKLDLESLRKKIGVVNQNGQVITDDIYHNIIISKPTLTLKEAYEAAKMSGLAKDIDQMPMGMSTMISEDGGGISGGQKQRLLIARAIAPKPKILIFDEATSALDNITQKQVTDALDSLRCTRIVVAHRISTIMSCDRIFVIDGGKIVEEGNYEQLIEANGYFADLVKNQRLDVKDE